MKKTKQITTSSNLQTSQTDEIKSASLNLLINQTDGIKSISPNHQITKTDEIKSTSPNILISQMYPKENLIKNTTCELLDPINLIKRRLDNGPIEMCEGKKSKHVCYQNVKNYYNDIFYMKNGVFCEMENIVLDPSKSRQSGISYLGPIDTSNFGMPLLRKGFFNAECNHKKFFFNYNNIYRTYFNSWNY